MTLSSMNMIAHYDFVYTWSLISEILNDPKLFTLCLHRTNTRM